MKIPETSVNVGAYYGNEENGQWQPNGMIIDSGVGGGVVGSGDAGVHRPPVYPVHIPRAHVPAGYVMAGAYYPPAPYPPVPAQVPDDFADYMWMENEEEFDKQVLQQLDEEALMEQCIEAMLADEQRERNNRPQVANGHNHHYPTTSNGAPSLSLEEAVSRSTLNPLAAEFVPTRARLPPPPPEQKQTETEPAKNVEAQNEETQPTVEQTPVTTDSEVTDENIEESAPKPQQNEPPEVSAADILPIDKSQEKRPKDTKKDIKSKPEVKKPVKVEVKSKVKSPPVKSEMKVAPKKKEVKPVKSDIKEEKVDCESAPVEVAKPLPTPSEEATPATTGFKPINYAAAAKSNKPKKPTTPTTEKTPPPSIKQEKPKTIEKTLKAKLEKPPQKTEKVNVQRKNSTK